MAWPEWAIRSARVISQCWLRMPSTYHSSFEVGNFYKQWKKDLGLSFCRFNKLGHRCWQEKEWQYIIIGMCRTAKLLPKSSVYVNTLDFASLMLWKYLLKPQRLDKTSQKCSTWWVKWHQEYPVFNGAHKMQTYANVLTYFRWGLL